MIAQLAGVPAVDPVRLRRNIVVSGINLLALRNVKVRVGDALLEIVPARPQAKNHPGSVRLVGEAHTAVAGAARS